MKETKFFTIGETIRVMNLDSAFSSNKLQPAVYSVEYDPFQGFYLKKEKDSFDLPKNIFGDTKVKAEKVINTYSDRNVSTGVLLTGNKGSGKTLLVEIIANKMIEKDQAVLLITKNFGGNEFYSFINSIGECVLLFDEFAKVYKKTYRNEEVSSVDGNKTNNGNQDTLLTMLDGTYSNKRLVLFTENSTWDINEYFINRPGRIYYHFKYNKLSEIVIKEFCEYKSINSNFINEIIEFSRTISEFNFDMLKAIVEEHFRYGENVILSIVSDLNIEVKNKNKKVKIIKIIDKDDESIKINTNDIEFKKLDSGDNNRYKTIHIFYDSLDYDPKVDDEEDKITNNYIELNYKNVAYEQKDKIVYVSGNYHIICDIIEEKEIFDYRALNYLGDF